MTTIEVQSSRPNRAPGKGFLFGSIRSKLLVILTAVGLMLLVTIVGFSYVTAQQVLEARAFAELEALRETRSDQLQLWLNDRRRDVQVLSTNPTTILAADVLNTAIESDFGLGKSYSGRLQTVADSYRNQPDLLDAGDQSPYSAVHSSFHSFFRAYRDIYGFSDIYLVTPNGNVIYSINKGADFGTNLVLGPYSVTNIGTAFQQALVADDPDFTAFADFAFYEPTNQAAAFLASPVFAESKFLGVLIFQLPIDIMNTIMNQRAGLGDTGETYAIGSDYLFRNDSRFLDRLGADSTILNQEFVVDTEASRSALEGESGKQIIEDYRGVRVLSAWKTIVLQEELEGPGLGGVTWAVLAEINEAEALQPAEDLLRSFLIIGALAGVFILGIGYLVANQIAKPIQRLTAASEQIAGGDLGQRADVTTRDEIGTLASTFNQMTAQLEATVGTLEQRVAERTRRLEIVAALSERLSAILDLDQLLLELVNLVKERFEYYHAHVYLIDDEQQNLVMTAGVGEAGEKMKAEGHAISLQAATSLVARAVRAGQIVTVDNVREAEDWLPNPLLPDTYSEMAVPIVLNEQVVGVLDVQEDKIAGLDESDAALLRSLANQVSVAIRNARLFAEVESALAEVRAVQERYQQQAWVRVQKSGQAGEYDYRRPGASLLSDEAVARLEQEAITKNQPAAVSVNDDGRIKNLAGGTPLAASEQAESEIQNVLVAPIKLQNQTIGAIQLHETERPHQWDERELALVRAVAEQVAQSAENIRLFEETRQRAGREQTIREITDKLRAAPNLERLLEIATMEISQRFPTAHAGLKLGVEPQTEKGPE